MAVYVPYTDGGSFLGSVVAPVALNATASVRYRGAWQRNALIAALAAEHGLAQATDVVFGGCSAGGLTIYLNIDHLAAATRSVAPAARVHALADAGFFLDHNDINNRPSRTLLFQWGFQSWNASAALSRACLAAYAAAPWHCIFAQYTARFIDTPVFLLNSKFDSCQLGGCELNIPSSQFAHGWNVRARCSVRPDRSPPAPRVHPPPSTQRHTHLIRRVWRLSTRPPRSATAATLRLRSAPRA